MNIARFFPFLRRPRTVFAAAIFGLAALSLMAAHPAAASGNGFHFGKWFIHLSFPNNEPLVMLTTEIWYQPSSGSAYLVTSQTDELDCSVVGNLQINNEIATFAGQEYITCDQPNMAHKIHDVSQGNLVVPPLVPVNDAWIKGEVAVAGGAPLNSPLPTYYHPSMQHAVARAGAGDAAQLLRIDGVQSVSSAYAQTAPHHIGARFKSRAECGSWKPYDTRFRANGVGASGTPAVINQLLEIGLQATTIYFGYSPANGSYFQGTIKTLDIDPGACGIGTG